MMVRTIFVDRTVPASQTGDLMRQEIAEQHSQVPHQETIEIETQLQNAAQP